MNKIVPDTNIYIGWIRERKYPEIMLDVHTQKYLSCIVLMELWAGARTRQAGRIVEKLQKPYEKSNRIVVMKFDHYIKTGQIIAALPKNLVEKRKNAGFINDIQIAVSASSVGATLITENRKDFELIGKSLPQLKVLTP
jgi:predicted nucleic acid-binding protein